MDSTDTKEADRLFSSFVDHVEENVRLVSTDLHIEGKAAAHMHLEKKDSKDTQVY